MYYIEPCLIFKNKEQFSELIRYASYLGYSHVIGFVEFNKNKIEELDEKEEIIKKIAEKNGIKAFFGILLKNHKQLKYVPKVRRFVDGVAMMGGDIKNNRIAIESVYVDFLIDPLIDRKKDCGINHVFAKIAKRNNIAIMINTSRLRNLPDNKIPTEITKIRELLRIVERYDLPITISSCTDNPEDLRDPLILSSFLYVMGLELKKAKMALSIIPLTILKENTRKRSKKWILPGVEVKKWGTTKR